VSSVPLADRSRPGGEDRGETGRLRLLRATGRGDRHGYVSGEPCLGYLVEHPDGLLLMDTGMGAHAEVDAHYRPRRRSLRTALADVGVRVEDVTLVVNCHLHFDHCGGNPQLPGRAIFTQPVELAAARGSDYTLPELVDAPGLRYEQLDGEAEVLPGVLLISDTRSHRRASVTGRTPCRRHRRGRRTKPRHCDRLQRRRAGLASRPRQARAAAVDPGVDRPAATTRLRPCRLRPRPRRLGALSRSSQLISEARLERS